ncbi:unnamed protein product [Mortierella alpina]
MDVKKVDPALASWDAQTEQDIFGNQAPYAAGSHTSAAPPTASDDEAPSIYQAHPYRPHTTQFPQSSPPYLEGSLPEYSQSVDPMPTAPLLDEQTQLREQQTSEPIRPSGHAPQSHQPAQQQQRPIQPFPSYGSVAPSGRQGPLSITTPFIRDRRSDSAVPRSSTSEHEPLVPGRGGKSKGTCALLRKCNRFVIGCIFLLMLIIYSLYRVLTLFVDPCALTSDSRMHYYSETWNSEPRGEISITLLDYIPGNVIIRESDDWEQDGVYLTFSKRSTSTKILDDIYTKAEAFQAPAVLRLTTLFRAKDTDERTKLLRGHCTKTETEIVYPKGVPYPQLLIVNGVLGNIRVQLDSPTTILDRIRLDVTNGSILIDGLSIRDEASFRVGTGKVQAVMRAIGEVNMETADGDIDVVLHPSLAFLDFGHENLNVTMKSMEGSITLDMVRSRSLFSAATFFSLCFLFVICDRQKICDIDRDPSRADSALPGTFLSQRRKQATCDLSWIQRAS